MFTVISEQTLDLRLELHLFLLKLVVDGKRVICFLIFIQASSAGGGAIGMINDVLGPADGGEDLPPFFHLVFLLADGFLKFVDTFFKRLAFEFGAVFLVGAGNFRGNVAGILFVGVTHAD